MRKRNTLVLIVGAIAGIAAYRCASRAWKQARAEARPYEKPTFSSALTFLDILRPLWRHPEALAMMRNNPELTSPLTDAVLAALLQGEHAGKQALADRMLAWFGVRGERIRGRPASTSVPVSPEEAALAADFARETLAAGAKPPADRVEELITTFGTRTAHDLVTFVRLVTAFVLVANTWEALISRLLGEPAPQSRASSELEVLAILALGVLPLVPVAFVRTLINPAGY